MAEKLDRVYKFVHHAGMEVTDGKPHWPVGLIVELPSRDALEVIRSLAEQLKDPEENCRLLLWGTLEQAEDENLQESSEQPPSSA